MPPRSPGAGGSCVILTNCARQAATPDAEPLRASRNALHVGRWRWERIGCGCGWDRWMRCWRGVPRSMARGRRHCRPARATANAWRRTARIVAVAGGEYRPGDRCRGLHAAGPFPKRGRGRPASGGRPCLSSFVYPDRLPDDLLRELRTNSSSPTKVNASAFGNAAKGTSKPTRSASTVPFRNN